MHSFSPWAARWSSRWRALAVDGNMRADPLRLVDAWGNGFWSLIPFTLQMAMMIIAGYVLRPHRLSSA